MTPETRKEDGKEGKRRAKAMARLQEEFAAFAQNQILRLKRWRSLRRSDKRRFEKQVERWARRMLKGGKEKAAVAYLDRYAIMPERFRGEFHGRARCRSPEIYFRQLFTWEDKRFMMEIAAMEELLDELRKKGIELVAEEREKLIFGEDEEAGT